jgi:hypothetical protein
MHSATIPIPGPNTGTLTTMYGDSAPKFMKAVDLQYGGHTSVTIPANGGFSVQLSECPKYLVLDGDVAVRAAPAVHPSLEEIRFVRTGRQVVFAGFDGVDINNKVRIYDVKGHLVNELAVNGQTATWNGNNSRLCPGIYIAKIFGVNVQKGRVLKIILPE